MVEGQGLRYDNGKLRYDLLEPFAIKQLVKVYTKGAEKYAERNWEKGMKWGKVLASLKRHIAAWEDGEDFDEELGTYHMANAAWNCMTLLSYYKLFPQGDDRRPKRNPRIALDIDEVLADFVKAWAQTYGDVPERPTSWSYDRKMKERFAKMEKEGVLEDFYLSLECKVDPKTLPFEPICYVTSRPVKSEITEKWLDKFGFPAAKVMTVPLGASKLEALKEMRVDYLLDDSYSNFVECNNDGIVVYLYDASHNQRYNVGDRRVKTIEEFAKKVM